jgi:hypothetical protein
MPRHEPKAQRGRLPDRKEGTALDIELHVGACPAPVTPRDGRWCPGRAARGMHRIGLGRPSARISLGVQHPLALCNSVALRWK